MFAPEPALWTRSNARRVTMYNPKTHEILQKSIASARSAARARRDLRELARTHYACIDRAHDLDSLIWPRSRSVVEGTRPGVRDGSIRSELQLLLSVLALRSGAQGERTPLLTSAPLAGVQIPQERNPMRPVATEDRYQELLKVADAVEPLGRFRCVLALAREAGRRINADSSICARATCYSHTNRSSSRSAHSDSQPLGRTTGRTVRCGGAWNTTKWATRP